MVQTIADALRALTERVEALETREAELGPDAELHDLKRHTEAAGWPCTLAVRHSDRSPIDPQMLGPQLVHVVMGNEQPDSVWLSRRAALDHVAHLKGINKARRKEAAPANPFPTIYWRVVSMPISGRSGPVPGPVP